MVHLKKKPITSLFCMEESSVLLNFKNCYLFKSWANEWAIDDDYNERNMSKLQNKPEHSMFFRCLSRCKIKCLYKEVIY